VDVPVTPDVHLALRGRTLPATDRTVLETAAGQALSALRQQRATAEAHQESADRLTALVDNLLDSSRLATGAVTRSCGRPPTTRSSPSR
jgi:two-component system sensor histidine kinase KdpD